MTEEKKIVLQKDAAWYDRNYEGNGDGPMGILMEAGMLVAMAGFFAAMLGLSHLVSFYERLRRR